MSKEIFQQLLEPADIKINGDRPWDIQVHNDDLYSRVLAQASLGFGESYMDGWWDCEEMDVMFTKIFNAQIDRRVVNWRVGAAAVKARLLNPQRKSKAYEIGEAHYDIGNDLYRAMLDDRMVYTCGYFNETDNLNVAQEQKLDLVCRKIGLKNGDHVLDIGCGWGSFAKFAAERYGARVTGVTVSKEQVELGMKNCEGLPVEIKLQDYRDMTGHFDYIVSLGMFEHVGERNYREYMEVAHRCLKDDGVFLLHTIGGNRSVRATNRWIEKYIFPNSMLPSVAQIGKSIEGLFVMEDWHNFGAYYDKTLMHWFANFDRAWPNLKSAYSERFYRMWKFYLLSCAGTFRARRNQLWQVVLTKNGIPGGHTTVR